MKKIKLLLGLGGTILFAAPVIAVTSCGSSSIKYYEPATTDTSKSYVTSDIGGIDTTFNSIYDQISTKANEIKSSTNEEQKAILNQPIIQITSANGVVNDNSFNQMTWEAISKFSSLLGVKTSTYVEDGGQSLSGLYNNALTKGYKIWVLTGWSHESDFANWIKTGNNKEKLESNNIKVVSIDWDVTQYVGKGYGLSLNFRTQESSFVIGYAISQYLGTNFSGADNANKRIINTSSGADASGSTNFNYGFLEGIKAWNDEQTNNDNKVQINIYTVESKVFLDTTYEANNPTTKTDFEFSIKGNGQNVFKGSAPTFVMPVAGDWSKVAADIIKGSKKKNEQWVIGVDTNMALSYGTEYAPYFATSSEKRIAIATFKALSFLTGITLALDNNSTLVLEEGINAKLNEKGQILVNNAIDNLSIIGGIAEGFVGASKSTIEDTSKATQLDGFITSAIEKFFGESGKLKQDLASKKQQYEEALKQNNIETLNQKIFEINNVLACGMTTNNKGYFNLIADNINSWLG